MSIKSHENKKFLNDITEQCKVQTFSLLLACFLNFCCL